jgi:hypothetical protein
MQPAYNDLKKLFKVIFNNWCDKVLFVQKPNEISRLKATNGLTQVPPSVELNLVTPAREWIQTHCEKC